ncbi:MAG: hypothetical protein ACE5NC_11780 [Anaerolineae bacterium]
MLLPVSLGLTGGALAAGLAGPRIYLVFVSAGFLGLGYYLAYWRGLGGRRQRVILWIATVVAVFFWVLPYLVGVSTA